MQQYFIPFYDWIIFHCVWIYGYVDIYIVFCLCIHSSMDIWVASIFWLSWMMLLWTYVYICLFEYLLSILSSIYLGVDLLGHMATLYGANSFLRRGTAKLSSTASVPFYIPTNNVRGFQFSCILTNTCCFPSLWSIIVITKEVWRAISLWFWFVFPYWPMILSTFSYSCGHFTYLKKGLFLERSISSPF